MGNIQCSLDSIGYKKNNMILEGRCVWGIPGRVGEREWGVDMLKIYSKKSMKFSKKEKKLN